MRGRLIPDTDRVVRHTKGSNVHATGRVSAAAFLLRSKTSDGTPEEYLSVNWLEYLHPTDVAAQRDLVRSEFAANLDLRRSQKLLVLSVGKTRAYVAQMMEDGRQLGIHHAELAASRSHSGVYDCRPDEDMVAELIAQTVSDIWDAIASSSQRSD